MPTPHLNFYPPAGQVIDASDSRVTWNGRAWMLSGRVYGVPSTHRLMGKPGGPLDGWYYDWGRRAWMEPDHGGPARPGMGAGRPTPIVSNPVRPQPQQPAPKPPEKKEECRMERKPGNVLESLIKHPVAPVIGGVLLLAAHFTDEPQPPSIPDELPEATQKQWQMIFNQNQQRFQRRMELYENLGNVLLGYASTQTVLDALPPKRA